MLQSENRRSPKLNPTQGPTAAEEEDQTAKKKRRPDREEEDQTVSYILFPSHIFYSRSAYLFLCIYVIFKIFIYKKKGRRRENVVDGLFEGDVLGANDWIEGGPPLFWLNIYQPECSRSASALDKLFHCLGSGALYWR